MKPVYHKALPEGFFEVFPDRPEGEFFEVEQVHGRRVVALGEKGPADGMVADSGSARMLIKSADCLPIVVLGERGRAFLHAGWRGVSKKIHLQPEVAGIRPYFAFVGPHIGAGSFVVGEELRGLFSPECFLPGLRLDLFAQVEKDLRVAFPRIVVDHCGVDTFGDGRFHSYRRDGTGKRNHNVYCDAL